MRNRGGTQLLQALIITTTIRQMRYIQHPALSSFFLGGAGVGWGLGFSRLGGGAGCGVDNALQQFPYWASKARTERHSGHVHPPFGLQLGPARETVLRQAGHTINQQANSQVLENLYSAPHVTQCSMASKPATKCSAPQDGHLKAGASSVWDPFAYITRATPHVGHMIRSPYPSTMCLQYRHWYDLGGWGA